MKIEQHVEQGACQLLVSFEISQSKASLLGRLYHVMHLTEYILKQHWLLGQALHPMQLLRVEELQQQYMVGN